MKESSQEGNDNEHTQVAMEPGCNSETKHGNSHAEKSYLHETSSPELFEEVSDNWGTEDDSKGISTKGTVSKEMCATYLNIYPFSAGFAPISLRYRGWNGAISAYALFDMPTIIHKEKRVMLHLSF